MVMLATLALMSWSLFQGLATDALFQFLLGASVALLLRRQHEMRQPAAKAASQPEPPEHD